jgi:hypothetical protein
MFNKIKTFFTGVMVALLVCSLCLNVYLWNKGYEIGYTEMQRKQMDQLAKMAGEM